MKEHNLSIPELISVLTCLENHKELEVTVSAASWPRTHHNFYTFLGDLREKSFKIA